VIVTNRRRFALGAAGLAAFLAVLAFWIAPGAGGTSWLSRADGFFNRLSKDSAFRGLPELRARAESFRGTAFSVSVATENPEDAAALAAVFRLALAGSAGTGAGAEADGCRARLAGDLGAAALALMDDAEELHRGGDERLLARFGLSGREVVYRYWQALGAIRGDCLRRGETAAAALAGDLRTRVCEPAYNFHGIAPASASESCGTLALLLGFYVAYTVWFGFSILLLFEGLGIGPRLRKCRET